MQEIALFPSEPDYIQGITLDGVTYRLRLWWCDRNACWYADLLTDADVVLYRGSRLERNAILFRNFVSTQKYKGAILVAPITPTTTEEITLDNLGVNYFLIYYTQAELIEIAGGNADYLKASGLQNYYFCDAALTQQIIDAESAGLTVRLYGR